MGHSIGHARGPGVPQLGRGTQLGSSSGSGCKACVTAKAHRAREAKGRQVAEPPFRASLSAAWDRLLQAPLEQLQQTLVDESIEMCTLRQASPFAGALDAQTRWQILKQPELRSRETR